MLTPPTAGKRRLQNQTDIVHSKRPCKPHPQRQATLRLPAGFFTGWLLQQNRHHEPG